MTKQHTPTPWAWDDNNDAGNYEFARSLTTEKDKNDPDYNGGGSIIYHQAHWDILPENAAFIVKAVNCHDILTDTLQEIKDNLCVEYCYDSTSHTKNFTKFTNLLSKIKE